MTRASAIIPFLPQEVRENLRSVIVEMSERPRLLIADGGRKSFIQEFQVASDGIVADVAVALKITHPMAGDLVIRLRHPDGDVAVLHDRDGWTADLDRVYGEKGAVIPKLRTFRGRSALGTWQILIENHSDGANGFLERAKLEIKLQD